jgi:hypothetical protein
MGRNDSDECTSTLSGWRSRQNVKRKEYGNKGGKNRARSCGLPKGNSYCNTKSRCQGENIGAQVQGRQIKENK